MDFKLYHYSTQLYQQLQTREVQGLVISAEERAEELKKMTEQRTAGPYYRHISFFFEPAPLDILADVFNSEHAFWAPGQALYEYVVTPRQLGRFHFDVVESPEETAAYYNPKYDSMTMREYQRLVYNMKKDLGYFGSTSQQLFKAALKLEGKARGAYLQLPERPNFESIKTKYAATVPHVMLYPHKGILDYLYVTPVMVGESALA